MHDGVFFEDNGIPTATVISTEFQRAARAQAAALGVRESAKPPRAVHHVSIA